MGLVLWVVIKYLKSPTTLFFKLNPICPFSWVSNEILYILVAKVATKITEVKCRGVKKEGKWGQTHNKQRKRGSTSIFWTSNLDLKQFWSPLSKIWVEMIPNDKLCTLRLCYWLHSWELKKEKGVISNFQL